MALSLGRIALLLVCEGRGDDAAAKYAAHGSPANMTLERLRVRHSEQSGITPPLAAPTVVHSFF